MIDARDITKTYPGTPRAVPVLQGLSLAVSGGETVALTGESGSGKSTLLHILGGLEAADTGIVTIAGQDVGALDEAGRAALRRDSIGLVFQQFNLIPSLDVGANLAFQARLNGRYDAGWAGTLAERLGLSDLLSRYPEELSGGQQQRVAIGRALASRPPVLMADEPTGNLDEDSAARVLDLMLSLVRETGTTLLIVTHSAAVAAQMDRRVHLSRGRLSAPSDPVGAAS